MKYKFNHWRKNTKSNIYLGVSSHPKQVMKMEFLLSDQKSQMVSFYWKTLCLMFQAIWLLFFNLLMGLRFCNEFERPENWYISFWYWIWGQRIAPCTMEALRKSWSLEVYRAESLDSIILTALVAITSIGGNQTLTLRPGTYFLWLRQKILQGSLSAEGKTL